MCSIKWHYFQWPWLTLTSPKQPVTTFCIAFYIFLAGAVLGIFIWVGQSKGKQILGRPTGVVYVGRIRLGRPGTSLGRPRPRQKSLRLFVRSLRAGVQPTLDLSSNIYNAPMRQPMERRKIGRCVRCICALCRVEEGTACVSSLSGIF